MRGDEGAGVHIGLEGRGVVVGLADDDVDDAGTPGGEDGVGRDGLGDGEVGIHDRFYHDVAAFEEGAEGLGERGGVVGDDAAGDEPAAPLEGAGADIGKEALVGFVEGGVRVGCEIVRQGRLLEFQSVELVSEGLEQGESLGLGQVRGKERPNLEVAGLVESVSVGAGVGDFRGDGVPCVDQGPEFVFGDDPGVGKSEYGAADEKIFEDLEGCGFDVSDCSACSAASQEPVDVRVLGGCCCKTGAVRQYTLDLQQFIGC